MPSKVNPSSSNKYKVASPTRATEQKQAVDGGDDAKAETKMMLDDRASGGDAHPVAQAAPQGAYQTKSRPSYSKCLINPRSMNYQLWQLWMAILLGFVAIFTPFEVAFIEPVLFSTLFWVNRGIDCMFLIDMAAQFVIPIKNKTSGKYERNLSVIMSVYLKGWFVIDFVSVIPFDLMADTMGAPKNLRMLRVVRLLRLVKLLKVLRSMQIFNLYQGNFTLSYTTKSLSKFFLGILMMAHWCACMWHLSSGLSTYRDNWVKTYGIEDASTFYRYTTSFYWAVMTLTTIGYGDVSAQNPTEQLMASIIMLLGGGVYAYVVGGICGIFASMNLELKDFYTAVDQLNNLMTDMNVPIPLQVKMRKYFKNCKDMHKEKYSRAVMNMMSPGLQRAFTSTVYAPLIENIPFLQLHTVNEETRVKCVAELVLCLRERYFPALEQVIRFGEIARRMFIIRSGLVGMKGKIYRADCPFGVDVICGGRREYLATTLTFTCIMAMTKDDMLKILQQGGYERIQKAVFGRARWMRVKAALLEMCRARQVLLDATAARRVVTYAWKSKERLKITISLDGEMVEQCLIGRHLTLLMELEELQVVLAPLREDAGAIRVEANSSALFRREVPVGEMDAKDISVLMSELMDEKLGPVKAELAELRRLVAATITKARIKAGKAAPAGRSGKQKIASPLPNARKDVMLGGSKKSG